MNNKVRKAVIPVAGYGTRFLPFTKAVPKPMLPILNKPALQVISEEVVNSGITDILFIVGYKKEILESHFDAAPELEKMLSGVDDDIQVNLSKSQIFFTIGDTQFTSRLLEGEFINYQHIIPKDTNTEITLSRKELLDSTERAALLAREGKNNLIKLDIGIDELTLTSNADIGEVHEVIPIQKTGDDLRIAFNSKFIIDALRAISEDTITIRLTNPVGPALIVGDDESFITLILPVRVSDDM